MTKILDQEIAESDNNISNVEISQILCVHLNQCSL